MQGLNSGTARLAKAAQHGRRVGHRTLHHFAHGPLGRALGKRGQTVCVELFGIEDDGSVRRRLLTAILCTLEFASHPEWLGLECARGQAVRLRGIRPDLSTNWA